MTNVFHPLFLNQSYLFIYYFTGFCQVPHKVFLLVRVHKQPSEHPAFIFQSAFCKEISNQRVFYSLLCSTSGEMKSKITLIETLRKEVAVRISFF